MNQRWQLSSGYPNRSELGDWHGSMLRGSLARPVKPCDAVLYGVGTTVPFRSIHQVTRHGVLGVVKIGPRHPSRWVSVKFWPLVTAVRRPTGAKLPYPVALPPLGEFQNSPGLSRVTSHGESIEMVQ